MVCVCITDHKNAIYFSQYNGNTKLSTQLQTIYTFQYILQNTIQHIAELSTIPIIREVQDKIGNSVSEVCHSKTTFNQHEKKRKMYKIGNKFIKIKVFKKMQ